MYIRVLVTETFDSALLNCLLGEQKILYATYVYKPQTYDFPILKHPKIRIFVLFNS